MSKNKLNTKARIVDEALTLFATKGFKGTSVKTIAEQVGIKDSSLYKHFKSKQEILDTIVEVIKEKIEQMSTDLGLPENGDIKDVVSIYAKYDEEDLANFSKKILAFYLEDPYISRFWRMGQIEQYNNLDVYHLFSKLFLEDSITYQNMLFKEMIKQKIFIDVDPTIMTMAFYSPIFLLLSKYNNLKNKNEAYKLLEKQVKEFYRIYKK